MSKRPRNTKRCLIIKEGNDSGTSFNVPLSVENVYDSNNRDKHEGIQNSIRHQNISQNHDKRQKRGQNRSSANIIAMGTPNNHNQLDDSNQISRGQALYQRSRPGRFSF